MENNIVLFDIDYTLFDVAKYREIVFAKLQELLPDVADVALIAATTYQEVRQEGWFEAKRFTNQLLSHITTAVDQKKLEDVWKDMTLLSEALYPEVKDVLTVLSNKGIQLGIFSSGDLQFQRSKITKLANFFEEEHIHIHELKDEKLPDIAKAYRNAKVVLIDDYIPVIEKAKQADAAITTVWIKRGLLAARVAPSKEYPPDYTIENLRELLPIIDTVFTQ